MIEFNCDDPDLAGADSGREDWEPDNFDDDDDDDWEEYEVFDDDDWDGNEET